MNKRSLEQFQDKRVMLLPGNRVMLRVIFERAHIQQLLTIKMRAELLGRNGSMGFSIGLVKLYVAPRRSLLLIMRLLRIIVAVDSCSNQSPLRLPTHNLKPALKIAHIAV
jgi:hypothetical protein